jgi:ABC-2 type transport system permease protein
LSTTLARPEASRTSLAGTPPAAAVSAATVFRALIRRDIRVISREIWFFLVRVVMQPVLFIIVFGLLLPKMGFVQSAYSHTLLPGVLAISIALSAVQAVALPMMQDFGSTREIEDRLLAPIPIPLVAVEKVIMGALHGVIAAFVVLPLAHYIMGPLPPFTVLQMGEMLAFTALGALAFSSLGMLLGTTISPQNIGLMFSIIVAPMIMFGCAYYPWQGLDAVPMIKYIVLINPLVYVAEGMRGVLTPSLKHMNLLAAVGALLFIFLVFGVLGLRSFVKRSIG